MNLALIDSLSAGQQHSPGQKAPNPAFQFGRPAPYGYCLPSRPAFCIGIFITLHHFFLLTNLSDFRAFSVIVLA
jgi:hypothetical protein